MPFSPRFIFAPALALLLAGNTSFAVPADMSPLYSNVNILDSNPDLLAELKITPEQEKGLKATQGRRSKIWKQSFDDCAKVKLSNLPESEKASKLRALQAQEANDTFQVYGETLHPEQIKRLKQILLQKHGMGVFDYPEIQAALKISDKEVKVLREAATKLMRETMAELRVDIKAKKVSQQDVARKAFAMGRSVPDKVRELLNKEQQKMLEDLLGDKFYYKSEK